MNIDELGFDKESVIDVNFVKEVDRILNEVNKIKEPVFFYDKDPNVDYNEFKKSGLLNTHFIDCDCNRFIKVYDNTSGFTEILKSISYNDNLRSVGVFFIKTLLNIRRNINKLDNPTFIENGVIIKIDDEFMYTGLSNFDFITMDYYKNR
jgi:hypothetical protein